MTQPAATPYPETGWYWHNHHDRLLEWCTGYSQRVAYIKETKPAQEIETRLRLMRPVMGVLPVALTRAEAELAKADAEWAMARAELDKAMARAELDKAMARAEAELAKAEAEWEKARAEAEWARAEAELDKARAEHQPEIEALHRTECFPDCPWNGQTIFP